jgi:hypothetical protein
MVITISSDKLRDCLRINFRKVFFFFFCCCLRKKMKCEISDSGFCQTRKKKSKCPKKKRNAKSREGRKKNASVGKEVFENFPFSVSGERKKMQSSKLRVFGKIEVNFEKRFLSVGHYVVKHGQIASCGKFWENFKVFLLNWGRDSCLHMFGRHVVKHGKS